MKKWICGIFAGIFLCAAVRGGILYKSTHKKAENLPKEIIEISDTYQPETIVTTDGECDDQNSFIHLLLCLNNMKLKNFIYSAGNEAIGKYVTDINEDFARRVSWSDFGQRYGL